MWSTLYSRTGGVFGLVALSSGGLFVAPPLPRSFLSCPSQGSEGSTGAQSIAYAACSSVRSSFGRGAATVAAALRPRRRVLLPHSGQKVRPLLECEAYLVLEPAAAGFAEAVLPPCARPRPRGRVDGMRVNTYSDHDTQGVRFGGSRGSAGTRQRIHRVTSSSSLSLFLPHWRHTLGVFQNPSGGAGVPQPSRAKSTSQQQVAGQAC